MSTKSTTDIMMSIKEEHMTNIAHRVKNHEYRKYLLPAQVERIWFYTTAPVQAIRYVARISGGKQPGDVPEDGGLGNDDFTAGRKESKYGYAILELWELHDPITLDRLREQGYAKGPPQKWSWVVVAMEEAYELNAQRKIF